MLAFLIILCGDHSRSRGTITLLNSFDKRPPSSHHPMPLLLEALLKYLKSKPYLCCHSSCSCSYSCSCSWCEWNKFENPSDKDVRLSIKKLVASWILMLLLPSEHPQHCLLLKEACGHGHCHSTQPSHCDLTLKAAWNQQLQELASTFSHCAFIIIISISLILLVVVSLASSHLGVYPIWLHMWLQ